MTIINNRSVGKLPNVGDGVGLEIMGTELLENIGGIVIFKIHEHLKTK